MKFVFKRIIDQQNDSVILVETDAKKVIALRFEAILTIDSSQKPDEDKRITPVFGIRHSQKETSPIRSHFTFLLNSGLELTFIFNNVADYQTFSSALNSAFLNSRHYRYLVNLK